ncbi:MAG: glycosyltransferase family 2 protein [Burkholderiales bacterium]|nr:glycosyltransferase family 2 protein [Burkholderiales bacterium]
MTAATTPAAAPLVSVGIPTYSRPGQLRATLEQIVGQSHSNLEIIVSDNATEGEAVEEVVRSFSAADRRIKYFRQESNVGPEENFQFVLDKATGDYFMWCADDDWHHTDFVARLLQEMLCRPEVSIAFCDIKAVDAAGNELLLYDGYYARLIKLTTHNRMLRQWRFYLQPEWRGKPCLMYGLLRREPLRGFSWPRFYAKHGFSFGDNLFAFTLLARGPVAAVPDKLFGFQVGNQKHYVDRFGPRFAPVKKLGVWLRYIFQYVRLVEGPAKLLYVLGVPWKTTQVAAVSILRRLQAELAEHR